MPDPAQVQPLPASLPAWAADFHPFTLAHALSVLALSFSVLVSCLLGRRWLAQRGEGEVRERKLAAAWAGFVIGVNLWSLVYWHLPGNFDPKVSLPIQLCDLACMLAPLVFLTDWRTPRALIYFWGIGLSAQAFITPTLEQGPADTRFYLFWLVHLGIVGSAVYDLAVRRYRPTLRDLGVAVAGIILYALAMVAVNHALDANYGFIGNQLRDRPTVVDKLGPWPERVFIMAGIVFAGFAVMWAVPAVIGRLTTPRRDPSHP